MPCERIYNITIMRKKCTGDLRSKEGGAQEFLFVAVVVNAV